MSHQEKNCHISCSRRVGNYISNIFFYVYYIDNKVIGQSHTGILIFPNMAPTAWLSRKRNIVESSSFTTEFTSLSKKYWIVYFNKLRMLSYQFSGHASIFYDNQSVVKISSCIVSIPRKKYCSTSYY